MDRPKTTTRADLCEAVHTETGLPVRDCDRMIVSMVEHIADALARGEKVKLNGFAVFEPYRTPGRTGRNPKKPNQLHDFPDRVTVRCRFSPVVRNAVQPPAGEARRWRS